jgi:FdhD protein
MGRVTTRTRITRIDAATCAARPDILVVEEPLEIRVGGRPLAVTMRTPGSDV